MSGQHPKSEAWDRTLQAVVEQVDQTMEARHGHKFVLGWNRPAAGSTCNPQMDGLFNIGTKFTLGFGSALGRGYVLDLVVSSRDPVPPATLAAWEAEAAGLVQDELVRRFPGRDLRVERDGPVFKIVGDFGLGTV